MNQQPTLAAQRPNPANRADLSGGSQTGEAALIPIVIDGKQSLVAPGATILEAARAMGLRIPTLCHHEDLCVASVCRICVVEVEGQRVLQASCSFPITQPITVHTYTRKVRKARRHILDLLLSEHRGECQTCSKNTRCELQALAKEYGVDYSRFEHPLPELAPLDLSSYSVVRDMNKCILCRRCVRTCSMLQEVGALGVAGRGRQTRVTTYLDKPLGDVTCINCGQCVNRCPTGALRVNDATDEVWAALDDPDKHVVIQTAPSPRAAIGEEFGMPAGACVTWELNTALRRCGFDAVFDTNFSADLTIMEEGAELLSRLYKNLVLGEGDRPLPMFTSCSPGWVKYIEHYYPEFLPHVSSCKSPQQMFGTLIKTWYAERKGIEPGRIVSVALMPCAAKKFECNRPEMRGSGYKDVDYALTTRELAQMLRESGMHLPDLPQSGFDDPFGDASGSGVIFGATGGVMEAALRTVIECVTGSKVENFFEHAEIIPVRGFEECRYAEIVLPDVLGPVPEILRRLAPDWSWLKGATLKVGVAHGTASARKVMEDIKAGGVFSHCHFIEFMACPGGCLGGGGQPIPTNAAVRAARAKAIYAEDIAYGQAGKTRKSHENPAVLRLYNEYLTEGPCSGRSHALLHTQYTPRGTFIDEDGAFLFSRQESRGAGHK
jgi:NADH-quinone oxidoreductase subunit G/[NiFe] hydrogenase diaphorase moiety small subunit